MAQEYQYQRMPSKDTRIKDITPEHIRVRILGKVIDKNDFLVVDDGTEKAELMAKDEDKEKVNMGDTVRVFVRVLPLEDGYELHGEIVQLFNDVDIDAYGKVFFED